MWHIKKQNRTIFRAKNRGFYMYIKNYIEAKINDKVDQIFQKNSEKEHGIL